MAACSMPAGYVTNGLDCDDATSMRYPGAPEYCDLVDQSCDGLPFNGCPSGNETISAPTYGTYYGGSGGTSFTDSCPTGYLLTGFDVWVSGGMVIGIRRECGGMSITAAPNTPQYHYTLRDGALNTGTVQGSSTGTMMNLDCPPDHQVSAIYGRSGTGLNALGLHCQQAVWTGGASSPPPWPAPYYAAPYIDVPPVGGAGGTMFEWSCPTPDLGRAIRGRTSGTLVALSLGCSVLDYIPQ